MTLRYPLVHVHPRLGMYGTPPLSPARRHGPCTNLCHHIHDGLLRATEPLYGMNRTVRGNAPHCPEQSSLDRSRKSKERDDDIPSIQVERCVKLANLSRACTGKRKVSILLNVWQCLKSVTGTHRQDNCHPKIDWSVIQSQLVMIDLCGRFSSPKPSHLEVSRMGWRRGVRKNDAACGGDRSD